jgi:hypothetical protein
MRQFRRGVLAVGGFGGNHAGDAGAEYFRKTMFLKYFPASFILTQGDAIGLGYARLSAFPHTVRVAAATVFAYIYMAFAVFDPQL